MFSTRDKILDRSQAIAWRRSQSATGRKVVFSNGCFDLLHPGHLQLLDQARALGDALIVGINADESVRRLKGRGRPVLPQDERAELLAALRTVDAVTIFVEDTPAEVVAALIPDVLVKGSDWGEGAIVGRDTVERHGGRVVRLPLVAGYSTSALVAAAAASAAQR